MNRSKTVIMTFLYIFVTMNSILYVLEYNMCKKKSEKNIVTERFFFRARTYFPRHYFSCERIFCANILRANVIAAPIFCVLPYFCETYIINVFVHFEFGMCNFGSEKNHLPFEKKRIKISFLKTFGNALARILIIQN